MIWLADNFSRLLSLGANLAQVLTAIVAGTIGVRYLWFTRQRRLILERYLKDSSSQDADARLDEVIAHSGMTEEEIFGAALASKHIRAQSSTEAADAGGEPLFDDGKNEESQPLSTYH